MIALTNKQKGLVLQAASGFCLNEEVDVNFTEQSEAEQNAFLSYNANEHNANLSPLKIFDNISDKTERIEHLLVELVGGLEEPANSRYFVVQILSIIDGQEVPSKSLVNAGSKGQAIEQAFHSQNYGNDLSGFEWIKEHLSATCLNGDIEMFIQGIDEVSQFEAMVLKKYM